MPLAPGARLGPYEIISATGAGGMGEVYRARDTRLGRTVAIKILPPELCSQPGIEERFRREAHVISNLSHPHICASYDVGVQDGMYFLVMEYLEGENLAARLNKGSLPVHEALRIASEVCEALEYAHREGIIHRDVKPSNIAITRDGAKLMDFGLAKPSQPVMAHGAETTLSNNPLTRDGAILGTLPYMAPEQLEGRQADSRTDIFALGCVIYEMVTGRRLFTGDTQAALISSILSSQPPPISASAPSAPPALDRVARACLAKKPDDRWQSAHDLKLELIWLQENAVESGGSQTVVSKAKFREKLAWGASLLLLVAVSLLAVVHFTGGSQPAPAVRASLLPPSGLSFVAYNFSISPNGLRLAFVAVNAEGKNTLWVRSLSASTAQQLSGTEGAMYPFWSPDSRSIGFFTQGKLEAIELGGAVRILCSAPRGRGGTWNRDGTIVFAPDIVGPLFRVLEAGGSPVPVTQLDHEGSGQAHRWPFFLPDGNHFIYVVDWSSEKDNKGNGIYVGALDSGPPKLLSPEISGNVVFSSGYLLYVHDRSLMARPFDPNHLEFTGTPLAIAEQEIQTDAAFKNSAFTVSQNGALVYQSIADSSSQLTWFDASGKELSKIPGFGFSGPHISPDGRSVAVTSDDDLNGKLYVRVYDLARGTSTRLTNGGYDSNPAWSPDGKWIAYVTSAAGAGNTSEISMAPADGSGRPEVLLQGAKMLLIDWSPGGPLAFANFDTGFPSLMVYSFTDHKKSTFSPRGAEPRFSPDGKWITCSANSPGISVQPYPGPGARIQISAGPGFQSVWSHDGKQIFYIAPDRTLMAVNFDPQKGTVSTPRPVFHTRIIAPDFVGNQFDVSSDGRFLINSLPSDYSSPLTLLTNWIPQSKR